MRIKKGLSIEKLDEKLKSNLKLIEDTCKFLEGKKYVVTITSTNDGKHMKGSLHYLNRAIDIRSRDMKYPVGNTLNIRKKLGKNYDVILEKDHIHIERDRNEK